MVRTVRWQLVVSATFQISEEANLMPQNNINKNFNAKHLL